MSFYLSESRFACDEEQVEMVSPTNLADLTSSAEDPYGRYGELFRRNSMVPAHLKSSYPVETQASQIPATPLKMDGNFVEFEDVSKRKRSTRSTSSSSKSDCGGTAEASTPQASVERILFMESMVSCTTLKGPLHWKSHILVLIHGLHF